MLVLTSRSPRECPNRGRRPVMAKAGRQVLVAERGTEGRVDTAEHVPHGHDRVRGGNPVTWEAQGP